MLDPQREQQFEQYVTSFMEQHQIPGVAIAIADGETVIYNQGFGWRDREHALPVTSTTVFGIASITKSFTALAIAQLVQQGLMAYDDPVQKFLPAFTVQGYPAEMITIRHFLAHTSGIAPLPTLSYSIRQHTPQAEPKSGEQEAAATEPQVASYDDLLTFLSTGDYDMLGPAGEYYSYSNDCYALLGRVIERVSGQTYLDYVQAHILDPLEMSRSSFKLADLADKLSDDVTELYFREGNQVLHAPTWQEAPPYFSCGWLRSSANDLIRYFAMYANGMTYHEKQLLPASGLKQMLANPFQYALCGAYATGLRVQPHAGVTLVCHSGGLQGVSSYGGFVPERNLSVVVLCNLSGVPVANLWTTAVNLGLGLPLELPLCDYQPTDWPEQIDLNRYCGHFHSAEGADLTIEPKGKHGLLIKGAQETSSLACLTDQVGLARINHQDTEVRWFFPADGGPAWAISCGGRMILRRQ